MPEPTVQPTAQTLPAESGIDPLVHRFIRFLETGTAPEGLFAEDVFVDFTMPLWRKQVSGRRAAEELRRSDHPDPGTVPQWRADPIPGGFVIEFQEAWTADGQQWIAREMVRADVTNGEVTELSVYCTGDWDEALVREHAATETMIRP